MKQPVIILIICLSLSFYALMAIHDRCGGPPPAREVADPVAAPSGGALRRPVADAYTPPCRADRDHRQELAAAVAVGGLQAIQEGQPEQDAEHPLNHGEGMREFRELGIPVQDIDGFDAPEVMRRMALDTMVDPAVGNEALNNLRRHGYQGFNALVLSIARSAAFSDDYRAYAVQHLVLNNRAEDRIFQQEGWLVHLLEPFLDKRYPTGVRREAAFGLAENDVTRPRAMAWLSGEIRHGSGREFGDLYVRICNDFKVDADLTVMERITRGWMP